MQIDVLCMSYHFTVILVSMCNSHFIQILVFTQNFMSLILRSHLYMCKPVQCVISMWMPLVLFVSDNGCSSAKVSCFICTRRLINFILSYLILSSLILSYLILWFHHHNITWWHHQWKHFLRYWPSVRGIHRSPVNSPHKGQWRGALMFSLICAWINSWVNNSEAGDLRHHRTHYDVILMNVLRKEEGQ